MSTSLEEGPTRASEGESQTLSLPQHTPSPQVVLVLVGLIGSGKSTFAQALERYCPHFRRCSQDDLGDRRSVEALVRTSLREGLSVCIDRVNFDESQRATWINIAHEFPGTAVWVIVFDTPCEICAERVAARMNHPTITSPELGAQILEKFRYQYRPPASHEGYTRILHVRPADLPRPDCSEDEIRSIMQRLQDSPEITSTAAPQGSGGAHWHNGGHRGGHRGGYRGYQPQRGFAPRDAFPHRGGSPSHGVRGASGTYRPADRWDPNARPTSDGPPLWSGRSEPPSSSSGQGYGGASERPAWAAPKPGSTEDNWRRRQ